MWNENRKNHEIICKYTQKHNLRMAQAEIFSRHVVIYERSL